MNKVLLVDGVERYFDTETAEVIKEYVNTDVPFVEILYRKKNGNYFLVRSIDDEDNTFIPFSLEDAKGWSRDKMLGKEYMEAFDIVVEE